MRRAQVGWIPPAFPRTVRHNTSTQVTKTTADKIVDAALDSFAKYGYHATSMRKLAETVGIQTASLYHWYPGKEALLTSIMDDFLGQLARDVRAAVERHATPIDRLGAAVRTHVIHHGRYRRAAFVTDTEVRALTGAERTRIVGIRDSYADLVRGLIMDGVESGDFRCSDPKIAALAILLECTGVAVWFSPSGPLTLEEVGEIHVDLVLGSLNARRDS